ncbi:transcription factor grauzone-like [Uranotaenia lowii]|uniref:transcription factor grauzone-like n=1 Tax=Uranotaenia lowii TaxID=190385 RepID=UPI00247960D5|nr:transcription factor grauzone-like [Uranotaenia lowii]
MSSKPLESCFTCLRRTDHFLEITGPDTVSGDNVSEVFTQHFWFTENEYHNQILCTSCWEKIDEFHKFYCEVERVRPRVAQVKEEKVDIEEDEFRESLLVGEDISEEGLTSTRVFVDPICKIEDIKDESGPSNLTDKLPNVVQSGLDEGEHAVVDDPEDEEASDHDDAGEEFLQESEPSDSSSSNEESESDSESDLPLAKRMARKRDAGKKLLTKMVTTVKRRRRRGGTRQERKEKKDNDELNQFIREHMDITCHRCAEEGNGNEETFESFYRLRVHFKNVHNTYGYVHCCNKKWPTKTGLAEHLKNHEPNKDDTSRCVECNCIFKDKNSYANHMFLVHTPENEKQFKCNRCVKAFAAQELLNSHLTWHDNVEKKNHYCGICDKYLVSARNLENHNLNHHSFGEGASAPDQASTLPSNEMEQTVQSEAPAKPKRTAADLEREDDLIKQFVSLNCSKCDFVGDTFNKLSYHAFKAHGMNSHPLICCDRKFGKRQRLYEHVLKHLNPDHFKCDICGKTYSDSSGLQIHKWWMHTPASERPFKCDICGASFMKDYLLKQHTNWHVNKVRRTHYCEICDKAYSNAIQLKGHQQKKHGAVSDWVCDICARGFSHRAALEEHRLKHSEEGLQSLKMQCEKCQKWLINKKSYLRHRRRCYDTTGPVTCDICGKVSINEVALMGHKNFHHSNRALFTCSFCGKVSKTQLRHKEHEATHTGAILYQCPWCPRTSNSSSNMYSHKKVAHPELWAEQVAQKNSRRGLSK